MPYSIVDGAALNDQECKRQDNGRAYDKAGTLERHRQHRRPQAGVPVDAPCRARFARENSHGRDRGDERDDQQNQKRFRQPSQELTRNVGAGQCIGPYPLPPMGEFIRHRDGRKVQESDLELRPRMPGLQPRPKRNRRHPRDDDNGRVTHGDLNEIAQGQPAMPGPEFRNAQDHRPQQIGVSDDAAGARGDREAGQETDDRGRPPGRQNPARHHHDGERRPRDRGEEWNINGREEQAAVEISRHQAQRDGGHPGPAADRKPSERQERRHAG